MNLGQVSQNTKDALRKANEVYDAALTLLTDVNGLSTPDIDIAQLKRKAMEANENVSSLLRNTFEHTLHSFSIFQANQLIERVNEVSNSNGEIFANFEDEHNLAVTLLER